MRAAVNNLALVDGSRSRAKGAEHNRRSNGVTLATADEAHELLIQHLGNAIVVAVNDGNRAEAIRYRDLMYRAIKSRSAAEIARRENEIDRAIDSGQHADAVHAPGLGGG